MSAPGAPDQPPAAAPAQQAAPSDHGANEIIASLPRPPKNISDADYVYKPTELVSQIFFGNPTTTPQGTVWQNQVQLSARAAADPRDPNFEKPPPIGVLIVDSLARIRAKAPALDDEVMKTYQLTTFLAEYTSRLINGKEGELMSLRAVVKRMQTEARSLRAQAAQKSSGAPAEEVKATSRQLTKEMAKNEELAKKLRGAEAKLSEQRNTIYRLQTDIEMLRSQVDPHYGAGADSIASLTQANQDLTQDYIRMQTYARQLEVELAYLKSAAPPPQQYVPQPAPVHYAPPPQQYAPPPGPAPAPQPIAYGAPPPGAPVHYAPQPAPVYQGPPPAQYQQGPPPPQPGPAPQGMIVQQVPPEAQGAPVPVPHPSPVAVQQPPPGAQGQPMPVQPVTMVPPGAQPMQA